MEPTDLCTYLEVTNSEGTRLVELININYTDEVEDNPLNQPIYLFYIDDILEYYNLSFNNYSAVSAALLKSLKLYLKCRLGYPYPMSNELAKEVKISIQDWLDLEETKTIVILASI